MEALRPPAGYTLDRAIGTTFTLDLLTLLTVPLSFTLFGWEQEDGAPSADPLTLFEGLRRFSERMTVFCHAGQITVPSSNPLLLGYLEDSVVEVVPSVRNHIFHPKVWILRLVSDDGPTLYRLLVASRNLTFDRSWDTMLVLDGSVSEERPDNLINQPLRRFVQTLPELALRSVSPRTTEAVDLVKDEILRVEFMLPPGFNGLRFWPLGIVGEDPWPFPGEVDRMLCVSPFATNGLLKRLPGREHGTLVSRTQELDRLGPETIGSFGNVHVLHEGAEPDDISETEAAEDGTEEVEPLEVGEEGILRGLHAKLYAADSGMESKLWTGSANATHAAFSGNVEFLVELVGETHASVIDLILDGPKGATGFADLLYPYTSPEEPPETDDTLKRLEAAADEVRRVIVEAPIRAVVTKEDDETRRYGVTLESSRSFHIDPDTTVMCRPIMLPPESSAIVRRTAPVMAEFELSLEAITSFFAFEVTSYEDEFSFSRRFIVNVEIVGAPEHRRDAIVAVLLSDRGRIMRLILMLLAEGSRNEHDIALELGIREKGESGSDGTKRSVDIPLFEEMVRSLWANPKALDRIDGMLAAVRKTENAHDLIPEELEEIWPQIMEARRRLKEKES